MSGKPRVITDENGVRIVIPPMDALEPARVVTDESGVENVFTPVRTQRAHETGVGLGPTEPMSNGMSAADVEALKKREREATSARGGRPQFGQEGEVTGADGAVVIPADARRLPGTPQVGSSPTGVPVVGTPAEEAPPPAPETTEELQARLAAEELANVDNPALLPEVAQARIKNLQEQGMSEAEAMKGVAELRAQHADQMEANAQRINQAMDEAIERHRVAQEDMRARADALYATRFEPRRIFSSPDAAANVGVHLGVAVGAMLQSFQNVHFPGSNAANTALSIVDRAIEADIAQQREAFSRGEGQLRQDSAAMEAMNRLGVQEVDALMFTRMAATEQVAEQLSSLAAAHAGTAAGQRFEQAALAMRERYMMLRGQLDAQAALVAAEKARTGRGGRATAGNPNVIVAHRARSWVPIENMTDEQRGRHEAYLDDASLQRNVTQNVTAAETAQQTADEIISLFRREGGTFTLSPSARAILRSKHSLLAALIKDQFTLGALDNGVIELVGNIAGDTSGVTNFTSAELSSLLNFRQFASTQISNLAETYGWATDPRRLATNQQSSESLRMGATESQDGEIGDIASTQARTFSERGAQTGNAIIDNVTSVVNTAGQVQRMREVDTPITEEQRSNVTRYGMGTRGNIL